MSRPRCRVYLVSPERFDTESFAAALDAALAGGDVACFQLRMKGATDSQVLTAAARLMPVCHARDVAFLINDRADLAHRAGADGVHLGQGDGEVAAARALLGPDRDIGVTCHDSRDLAYAAGEAGADYVAFGAFFPTATKAAPTRADPELLEIWSETTEIPCVAIGGITAGNCAPLVRAGADFLAVSGYVWNHGQGPAEAVRELEAAIAAAD